MDETVKKYLTAHKNINRGFRYPDVWKEGIELFAFIKMQNEILNPILKA